MRALISAKAFGRPSIGLALFGCANRPFYQICVFPDKALGRHYEGNIIEQLGTFDPVPNIRNEKLVSLDIGRIKYWVGVRNAHISLSVLELLGVSGLFPIHPKTFIRARKYREAAATAAKEESEKPLKAKEIGSVTKKEPEDFAAVKPGGSEDFLKVEDLTTEAEKKAINFGKTEDPAAVVEEENFNTAQTKEEFEVFLKAKDTDSSAALTEKSEKSLGTEDFTATKEKEDSEVPIEATDRATAVSEKNPGGSLRIESSLLPGQESCSSRAPPCVPQYGCYFHDGSVCDVNAFSFENESTKCDAIQRDFPLLLSGSKGCEQKDLDVSLKYEPGEVKDFYPHLVLNITSTVYSTISALFIRISCLHAVKLPDTYCTDTLQTSPCRSWLVTKPNALQYPLSVSFACFALTALNTYTVTVSIAPQNCTSTFAVNSPLAADHPDLASYFDSSLHSPFLFVDLTPEDGVWLRYYRSPTQSLRNVTHRYSVIFIVCLGEYEKDCPRVFEKTVQAPSTGVKWINVPVGNYTALAIIDENSCLMDCNNCRICANHSIKFSVKTDKFTLSHQTLRSVQDFAKFFVFGLLVVLAAVAGFVFAFIALKRRGLRSNGFEERELALISRPKVLLLYSYDCLEHSKCILILADFLKIFANADILLDQFALNTPGVIPARWLADAFVKANYILTVCSESSLEIMNGKSLKRDFPFPDLFDTAMTYTLDELSKFVPASGYSQSNMNTRFIFAYFSYSSYSVIPSQIHAFPVHVLCLPDQLGELVMLLHDESLDNGVIQHVEEPKFIPVVQEIKEFREHNPNWLDERLNEENVVALNLDANKDEVLQPNGLETAPLLATCQEVIDQYNIEPPDEDIDLNLKTMVMDNGFPLVHCLETAESTYLEGNRI